LFADRLLLQGHLQNDVHVGGITCAASTDTSWPPSGLSAASAAASRQAASNTPAQDQGLALKPDPNTTTKSSKPDPKHDNKKFETCFEIRRQKAAGRRIEVQFLPPGLMKCAKRFHYS